MQYQQLTVDQRRQLTEERLMSLERDHFGHALNIASLDALPTPDDSVTAGIAAAVEAQATIEAAVMACRAELAALDE